MQFAISRPRVQSPRRQGRPTTCKTFETRAEADRLFDFHPDAVTKAMTRACKKAGLRDLHFHDLRHEATSRLFENTDLDLMEIRSITGHKTLQVLGPL